MTMKKIEETYKVLDHISHIILRPQTYLGSNKPHLSSRWIFEDDKMVKRETNFVPSFLKVFDEIITNAVDEHKRNPQLNKIEVNLDVKTGKISVKDNGGIPVQIHKEHGKYVAEVIFGNLMSGSNYDDSEDRVVAGTNGYGSKLTNVFSKQFTISTCDGKKSFLQTFSNNMRERTEPIIKNSKINHTQITYIPDYEKFGLSGLNETHFKLIQKRVIDIAGCNPGIQVFFNTQEIKIKSFEDYVRYFKSEFYFESNKEKTWNIAIASSNDGFNQVSFVNSTETWDGGTHVDYILNQIVTQLREFFQKKHKVDIKPSEIKNHLSIYLNTTVVNPSFSSQTKDKLITETKDFGFTYEVSEKMIKWILKSEIVDSIIDWIQKKKNADESKLARELNKNLSKLKVEKLIDAKAKERWKCSLLIFEGDSASSSVRKYRDPQTQGSFSLRGKFINAAEITTQKLIQNNEVVNLMASMGLKLGQKATPTNLRYGRFLFFVDSDKDGNSIAALLINFFFKFWPELFENQMILKAETPIVVVKNIKTKKKTSFYTQSEYDNWLEKIKAKDWEIEYKKGLAALLDDEYAEIINNPILTQITTDDLSKEFLNIWFGKDSELRKKEMLK